MTQRTATDIDVDAARYVAQMDRDDWSDEQEEGLQDWLALDPRHPGALLRAQAAWMSLDPPRPTESIPLDAPKRSGWLSRRSVFAGGGAVLAASFMGALMLGGGTSYATSVGEIRRVPLADGSIAAINTASEISVTLEDAARRVSVEEGEVWFQVAKDKQRPFVVAAGRARIRAVGTAFSVRRRVGGAEVLVTEGTVEVWADGAEGHRVRISAGSRGFIADNAAIKQESAEPSAIDRTLAWRSGKVDLSGDRLDSAVAEFNRYNERKLVVANPAIAGERLDGVFRTDDPEGFAQAVHITLGVPIDVSDSAHIRIGALGR
ncbi:FecR domain-containing protein [Sphingopyxis sp.]|uniref:FecR family protein n=1 Tax=Sphingopyxis sp. TaxID=1908224 RepID=UPI00261B9895|nr:FecR domain-containing protein [Sphingopyxis sp.]MCW0198665.1 FecR domain-containing protein [Sphingopyxis sp.]